jgi:hypothetical protein
VLALPFRSYVPAKARAWVEKMAQPSAKPARFPFKVGIMRDEPVALKKAGKRISNMPTQLNIVIILEYNLVDFSTDSTFFY